MITVEIVGEVCDLIEPEMLRHAAASVFHYFKVELEREAVTIGEFTQALEKVLRHLGFTVRTSEFINAAPGVIEADLGLLARESGHSLELLFFPRLRDELRAGLRRSPRVVRFRGLRGCVKKMAGARRWSNRCEQLQEQIVEYLRGCLTAEPEKSHCALVVE
jgi:hypothetical protein